MEQKRHSHPLSRLCPFSAALLIIGHILILASLCDFAARLHGCATGDALFYVEEFMHAVSAAGVLTWGISLLADYAVKMEESNV